MRHPRVALLLLAVVALVVAFVMGHGGGTPTSLGLGAAAADEPEGSYGFTARDVVVQQTDASGRLQYEVLAAQVERQNDTSPVVAHELTLQYEPVDQAGSVIPGRRWTLRSDEGQLPGDTGELQLAGGVEVQAQLPGSPRPLTLRTDQLLYRTREQTLDTAARVLFSWGRQQLQATGLKADIKTGTLTLESDVHGRISP
ncbi:MAG: LPS export ABC transporter periplasmic protein LptC [Steroidobacteraceae bacterium]